jgi:nucleotide-binding universal stress UspA family protein
MFDHILLPLDGSQVAECVLPHALSLAKAFGSKITFLRVVEPEKDANHKRTINPIKWQMQKSEAEAYLQTVKKRFEAFDIESDIKIVEGKPAKAIIAFVRQNDVKLIVLSSHGESGISEWNINSTVQKVLLRAFVPLMIVRAYKTTPKELKPIQYQRIFMPLDGSKRAECVLPLANGIRDHHHADVVLAHIVEEPIIPRQIPLSEAEQDLIHQLVAKNIEETEKYLEGVKSQYFDQEIETIIQTSKKPTIQLHHLVDKEKIDLVLLSAHGLSGEKRWPYGNIALNFIVFGTTPIIIIQDIPEESRQKTTPEKMAHESKGH